MATANGQLATGGYATARLRGGSADHRFFLVMALVMAGIIAAGFSMQLAMGRSTFRAPAMLHVHAGIFFGWTALYVLQTALVDRGSIGLHRRLGWVGAGWAMLVVALGIYMTVMMVRRGAAPFFFQPSYFLFMNALTVLGFGGLTAAAVVLRRRTAWHRRLMMGGTAILTGPAFGRLMPMPLLIPWAGWAVFVAVMLLPLAGAIADRRRRGKVHPAWWWVMATIAAIQVLIGLVAGSAPGLAIYDAVVAGGAGARVPPLAYPAPPPL